MNGGLMVMNGDLMVVKWWFSGDLMVMNVDFMVMNVI